MRRSSVKRLSFIAFAAAGILPLLLFSGAFWSVLRRHLDKDSTSRTVLRAVSAQTTSLVLEDARKSCGWLTWIPKTACCAPIRKPSTA